MRDVTRLALRLAALLPLVVLLVGVNAGVDPARLFDGGRTVRAIAEAMGRERRVTALANFDERALQRAIAQRADSAPPVLVLGSSRVMTLGSAELGTAGARNAGVSGAGLLDVLGIYELYRQRGFVPRQVVLGVDPWMFNAQSGETRWVNLAAESRAMLRRLQLPQPSARAIARARLSRLATLVSLDYFQASLAQLQAEGGVRRDFRETVHDSNPGLTRQPDGSITYGEELRHASPGEVARSARTYAQAAPVYQLGGFTRIDPVDSSTFERFVQLVRSDGAAVTLFLAPYHPIVYDALRRDPRYAQVAGSEQLVRRTARRTGVRVCGSYDPAAVGLGASDFYDGMHARPAALARALRACASP